MTIIRNIAVCTSLLALTGCVAVPDDRGYSEGPGYYQSGPGYYEPRHDEPRRDYRQDDRRDRHDDHRDDRRDDHHDDHRGDRHDDRDER